MRAIDDTTPVVTTVHDCQVSWEHTHTIAHILQVWSFPGEGLRVFELGFELCEVPPGPPAFHSCRRVVLPSHILPVCRLLCTACHLPCTACHLPLQVLGPEDDIDPALMLEHDVPVCVGGGVSGQLLLAFRECLPLVCLPTSQACQSVSQSGAWLKSVHPVHLEGRPLNAIQAG